MPTPELAEPLPDPELEPLALPPPLVPELVGGAEPTCGGLGALPELLFELPPQPSSAREAKNVHSSGNRDIDAADARTIFAPVVKKKPQKVRTQKSEESGPHTRSYIRFRIQQLTRVGAIEQPTIESSESQLTLQGRAHNGNR